MEIAPPTDFNFNFSSPFSDAHYTSAPSSPTRLTEMYCEFDELLISAGNHHRTTSIAAVPFAWEEKPGVPKTFTTSFEEDDDEFSFDLSSHNFCRDSVLIPAEDLFQGGVIKTVDDPDQRQINRGRQRSVSRLPSSSRSRRTRSLSPLGSSEYRRHQQQPIATSSTKPINPSTNSISSSTCTPAACENGSRRWSFRDFFLFRSASDGRAMDKDPLKKYSTNFLRKQDNQDSTSKSGSVSKRRGQVSAHEQHYNMNRALSNDMKKKTYLPYKQGIFGGLPFNV